LREQVYPDIPTSGPGSLVFSHEAIPLTSLLLRGQTNLDDIDHFLREEKRIMDVIWPWTSPQQYKARLEEAHREWAGRRGAVVPRPAATPVS
jgi:hypothetical protein